MLRLRPEWADISRPSHPWAGRSAPREAARLKHPPASIGGNHPQLSVWVDCDGIPNGGEQRQIADGVRVGERICPFVGTQHGLKSQSLRLTVHDRCAQETGVYVRVHLSPSADNIREAERDPDGKRQRNGRCGDQDGSPSCGLMMAELSQDFCTACCARIRGALSRHCLRSSD